MTLVTLLGLAIVGTHQARPIPSLHALTNPIAGKVSQFSSYDRASKSEQEDWFANADYGQYLRKETVDGRIEHVMADMTGPGFIERIWSANPSGTIRFYFDGATTPSLKVPFLDLLSGKVSPFNDSISYMSARGCNLYQRIYFDKSIKVTLESANADRIYYHIGVRSLMTPQSLEPFKLSTVTPTPVPQELIHPTEPSIQGKMETIQPGVKQTVIDVRDQGTLENLNFGFAQIPSGPNPLRMVRLIVRVDGELTVDCPLKEFFALKNQEGLSSVSMQSVWPMPFARSIRVELENLSGQPITVVPSYSLVDQDEVPAYRFYCHYQRYEGSTRPHQDMMVADLTGQGNFVGTVMTVENPVVDWWGEGDEKVTIDGADFPQFFGTGTEDYFGYAWCTPEVYARPYHGQPQADGPGNFGVTVNYRWHIADPINFQKSLKFTIESWHWRATDTTFNIAAFWYGEPGRELLQSDLPEPVRVLKAKGKVPGAIEGESLTYSSSAGQVVMQSGYIEISDGKQLWWVDPPLGSKLTLHFNSPGQGRYRIVGNFCHAKDYGVHMLKVNGQELSPIDFYSPELTWQEMDLGAFELKQGVNVIEVTALEPNATAEPRRMFGLDYIKLVPQSDP